MRRIVQVLAVALALFATTSCSEEMQDPLLTADSGVMEVSGGVVFAPGVPTTFCGSDTVTLWAGKTINAGNVVIANDATNLYVTVTSTCGFQTISENIKMWLGTNLENLDGGGITRPSAGGFPYKATVTSGNTHTFTVPLNLIPFYDATKCGVQPIYVVVHADVLVCDGSGNPSGGETAFGGDVPGPGKAWWFYSVYTPVCCETPPPPPSTNKLGTAFAKGGWVFTTDKKSNPEKLPSLNLTKNRWGWAINLTTAGTTTYDLWVGAGLNYTSKGIKVGSVTITYNGLQAIVTYTLNSGYVIEEAHVYAGDFKPTTLAPGQYGNTICFDPLVSTYTLTVDVADTNGDGVWFIVHAVAYGPSLTNPV